MECFNLVFAVRSSATALRGSVVAKRTPDGEDRCRVQMVRKGPVLVGSVNNFV
jgi:hypothetical protein